MELASADKAEASAQQSVHPLALSNYNNYTKPIAVTPAAVADSPPIAVAPAAVVDTSPIAVPIFNLDWSLDPECKLPPNKRVKLYHNKVL